tara:strand:+ start:4636 stop:4881 length:246 start_codon:yes stop_codon:yes gene_type:complete
MNASLEKRINIATSWVSNRISVLDNFERYEDSYALTEEFREWITCSSQHQELLEDSILKFPNSYLTSRLKEAMDSDEVIEL